MEKETRSVKFSEQFYLDIAEIFLYGYETFGKVQASIYEERIYALVDKLDLLYSMYGECRYIPTKSRMYRNIILESHLIIYRITPNRIEVLRVLHSHSSIYKIRSARSVKI